MKRPLYFFPLLFGFVFLYACKSDSVIDDPLPDLPTEDLMITADNLQDAALISQVIGWKVFNLEQAQSPSQNVVISPLSIQLALQLLLNGAETSSREALLALMNCPDCSQEDLNSIHKELINLLQTSLPNGLTLANAMFYDPQRIQPYPDYLNALATYFDCNHVSLDFNNGPASVEEVNAWVEEQTNGLIEEILSEIRSEDVAFLINALHFKADWLEGFNPDFTYEQPFYLSDGSQVTVPMMNSGEQGNAYAVTDDYVMVDIALAGGMYSASLIKAGEGNDNPLWHQAMTSAEVLNLYDNLIYARAAAGFPRLSLDYDSKLKATLETLGLEGLFDPGQADLSSMGSAPGRLFVGQVVHKTVLEVDEQGIEGAAVTSVEVGVDEGPFYALYNKPFILLVRHKPTNALIFQAFIADPS